MKKFSEIRSIAVFTALNPWGTGGGCAATRLYIDSISELFPDAEIHLCIYDRFANAVPGNITSSPRHKIHTVAQRPFLKRLETLYNGVTHRFSSLCKKLVETEKPDFCFFDNSRTSAGLTAVCRAKNIPTAVSHQNHEPEYFRYEQAPWWYRRVFMPHVRRSERKAYREATLNLFLTESDLEKFREVYGETASACAVTGFFEAAGTPLPTPTPLTANRGAITGSLNNPQNLETIEYFFARLYDRIGKDTLIEIAGQKPGARIRQLCRGKNNIILTASPDDMGEVIARAGFCLYPIRVGGGIKIRVTDALRHGRPVLLHRNSLRGYERLAHRGVVHTFVTPEEFETGISEINRCISSGEISPGDIQQLYLAEFSHIAGINRLKNAFMKIFPET